MPALSGTIIHYEMLTPHVLEMILTVPEILPFVPGQWALLGYEDSEGIFKRAYSLANYEVVENTTHMTFCIKLLENGRGSAVLKNKKVGDTIEVGGIFGHFQLQNTDAPKVFIGTGTGLVPAYHMAKTTPVKNKMLIFSVPYKNELFYVENIKNIPDLKYEIYVTREEVPGFHFGRFDLSKFNFTKETEFYVCGNPEMVKATTEKLKELGFGKIYSEQF